ncbi:hypothetical protein HC341_07305 [Aquisalimonas sp. 2447]|uniref:hypothetical protein n=1 Tax=Aquisalimonas sp. 2447 TaxID=2740807 RepID=UPI0014325274|nr:hypothetical protein [Aquisalimonas sp. 2447]QIT55039.1 hypothetical protein HC341_07305 [Aquisalimonas sp. 2447]
MTLQALPEPSPYRSRTNQIQLPVHDDEGRLDAGRLLALLRSLAAYVRACEGASATLGYVTLVDESDAPRDGGRGDAAGHQLAARRFARVLSDSWQAGDKNAGKMNFLGSVVREKVPGERARYRYLAYGLFGPHLSGSTDGHTALAARTLTPLDDDMLRKAAESAAEHPESLGYKRNWPLILVDLAFRAHMKRVQDEHWGEPEGLEAIFSRELMFTRPQLSMAKYLRGFLVQPLLNKFGILSLQTKWKAYARPTQRECAAEIGQDHGWHMHALHLGLGRELDGRMLRSVRPPFMRYSKPAGTFPDGERPPEEVEKLLASEMVFQNLAQDRMEACLRAAGILAQPVVFDPQWTTEKPVQEPVGSDVGPERIYLSFSPEMPPDVRDLAQARIQEHLSSGVFRFERCDASAIKCREITPVLFISRSLPRSKKGPQAETHSSIVAYPQTGEPQVLETFFKALELKERAPATRFDPYTEIRLRLYRGDFSDWQAYQNIDLDSLGISLEEGDRPEDASVPYVISRAYDELCMKYQLDSGRLQWEINAPEELDGEYVGLLARSPKSVPVRAGAVRVSLEDQVLSIESPVVSCCGANGTRWRWKNNAALLEVLQELKVQTGETLSVALGALERHLSASSDSAGKDPRPCSPVFNEQFLLLDLHRLHLLKVTAGAAEYVPKLLGQTEAGADYPGLARRDHDAKIGLARSFTRSSRKEPKTLVPHMRMSQSHPIAMEVLPAFARVAYYIQESGSGKFTRNLALRDMVVHDLGTDGRGTRALEHPHESNVLRTHLMSLTSDRLKRGQTSRMSMVEKMLRLLLVN